MSMRFKGGSWLVTALLVLALGCGSMTESEEAALAAESHLQAGMKFFKDKDYLQARAEFEAALARDQTNQDAANALAWVNQILQEKGRLPDLPGEEPTGDSGEMVEFEPDSWEGKDLLVAPELITDKEPMEFWAAYTAGVEAYLNGDYDAMLAAAEEALQWLSPDSEMYDDVAKGRLLALIEKNYYAEGAQAVSELLAQVPADLDLLTMATLTYERAGYLEDAVWAAEQAYYLDPSLTVAQNNLAYTYAQAGAHLDFAYQLAAHALAQDPNNPAYLDTMGWVLYQSGNAAAAYGFIQRALELVQHEGERAEIASHYDAIRNALN